MQEKLTDTDLILSECTRARAEGREISDACARMIASQWASGVHGYEFASTGFIADPSAVWHDLFGNAYESFTVGSRLMADMIGTYLTAAVRDSAEGERQPVAGWSALWLTACHHDYSTHLVMPRKMLGPDSRLLRVACRHCGTRKAGA